MPAPANRIRFNTMKQNLNAEIATRARVEFSTWAVDPDGTEHELSAGHNLILDGGMDMFAVYPAAQLFRYCSIGEGTKPTSRDSGAITFSRAGSTVTASAGFFLSAGSGEAGDVGRIIKWDTGERARISYVTDSTHVETVDTGTIASAAGTVWYVNETAHALERMRTLNVSTVPGSNLSTFSVDTWTHQRIFLFDAAPSNYLIKEIGWSPAGGSSALYGRALVPGGGDSLAAGQRYKVRVRNKITYSGAAAVNAFSSGTFSTAGTSQIEKCLMAKVQTDGSSDTGVWVNGFGNDPHGWALEPCVPNLCTRLSTVSTALQAMGIDGPDVAGDRVETVSNAGAFVSGIWTRAYNFGWGVTGADLAGIRSLCFFDFGPKSTFRTLFDTAQTKEADYEVYFSWLFSWDRDMPN